MVTINPDGTGTNDRRATMIWTLKDAVARVCELKWSNGYTDIATLSADGKTLAIVNAGTRFTAERIGDAPPPPPAQPLDLTSSWSGVTDSSEQAAHAARPVIENRLARAALIAVTVAVIWLAFIQAAAGRNPANTPTEAADAKSDGMLPLAEEALDPIAGNWAWATGSRVVFNADGTGNDDRGNSLAWRRFDIARRFYVIRWSFGLTDSAILAADGMSMEVESQMGFRFAVHRLPDEQPPADPAGGWSDMRFRAER